LPAFAEAHRAAWRRRGRCDCGRGLCRLGMKWRNS
jgi:hypothetical protein